MNWMEDEWRICCIEGPGLRMAPTPMTAESSVCVRGLLCHSAAKRLEVMTNRTTGYQMPRWHRKGKQQRGPWAACSQTLPAYPDYILTRFFFWHVLNCWSVLYLCTARLCQVRFHLRRWAPNSPPKDQIWHDMAESWETSSKRPCLIWSLPVNFCKKIGRYNFLVLEFRHCKRSPKVNYECRLFTEVRKLPKIRRHINIYSIFALCRANVSSNKLST